MSRILPGLSLLLTLVAGGTQAQTSESAAVPDSVTYPVYSALVNQHYDQGADLPLVLLGASVDRSDDAPLDDHLRSTLQDALHPVSIETLTAFEKLPATPALIQPRLSTRRTCRLVSRAVLDSLFSVCPGGWDRFATMFPRVRGYVTLSRVACDPSFSEALVYTEDHCGMFCGEGTFVFLQRENGAWKVERKLTCWVS